MTSESTTPYGYVHTADEYLTAAGEGIPVQGMHTRVTDDPARQVAALQGIGYALLAIVDQLGDANDTAADIAAHLKQLAMTADDLACGAAVVRVRHARRAWAWLRRPGPRAGGASGTFPPAADPGQRAGGTSARAADLVGLSGQGQAGPVPVIIVPRYAAPLVTATPVAEVISPEPAEGQPDPGHYQHLVLDTRTGALSFHESTQHLEPPDPAQEFTSDVPRETWERWYPGTLFRPVGPYMWFEPVPRTLYWVIGSGVPEWPYLDADAANSLLDEVAPHAQALLDGLFDAAGDLDWSAGSAHAGRDIRRLCSRTRKVAAWDLDADLVNFKDIVGRFPQVYRPELTSQPDLADECAYITRFLGSNEYWHPEVKQAFGRPYPDGSGLALEILGVRAWYRTAAGVIA
jgi:hypothetical protein